MLRSAITIVCLLGIASFISCTAQFLEPGLGSSSTTTPSVSRVALSQTDMTITGIDLDGVTELGIEDDTNNVPFKITSQSTSQIIAYPLSAANFLLGKLYRLTLVKAQATQFPITIEIPDGSITAAKLDRTYLTTVGGKFSVSGTIESTTGGFKFPNGTFQTSSGISGNMQVFQTAGSGLSFQLPAGSNLRTAFIEVWGAGGGGSGGTTNACTGGPSYGMGGGGGGYAAGYANLDASVVYTVDVGTGGTAGAGNGNGGAGGQSRFTGNGTTITASGGGGGTSRCSASANGGSPGTGIAGTLLLAGGDGGTSIFNTSFSGGGSAPRGGNGARSNCGLTGGIGGGGGASGCSGGLAGGAGGVGMVVISW